MSNSAPDLTKKNTFQIWACFLTHKFIELGHKHCYQWVNIPIILNLNAIRENNNQALKSLQIQYNNSLQIQDKLNLQDKNWTNYK